MINNDTHRNDFTAKYGSKGDREGSVSFEMQRCNGDVVSNQGVVAVFPNDSLAVGFIYDWKLILSVHGVGKYKIIKTITIAGLIKEIIVGSYELKNFSTYNARDSVRIYSEFNTYSLTENIDFTNSNVRDTLRFNGFFGNREPETQINNLIDKGRKVVKVIRENLNRYTLLTDPIEIGMTTQIDRHFLNEDIMLLTDYNRFNHDYDIFDKAVVLIDTPKFEYIEKHRNAKITATFGLRKLQDKSYYR